MMGPANEVKGSRDSWDVYFLKIAEQVATRATCDVKRSGCVVVKHRTILATGYNGSIRGMAHCDEAGHMLQNGSCIRTLHAEANALIQAALNGVSTACATIYCTSFPCWECFKLITNSGVKEIIYSESHNTEQYTLVKQVCFDLGISLKQVIPLKE